MLKFAALQRERASFLLVKGQASATCRCDSQVRVADASGGGSWQGAGMLDNRVAGPRWTD